MRTVGKIFLWLGIIIMVLTVVLFALAIALSAADSEEAMAWAIGFAIYLGIPTFLGGAILTLIGVVVITSLRKPAKGSASLDPSTSTPQPYRNVILGLRVVAVALFAWKFAPEALTGLSYMATYVDVTVGRFAMMTLIGAMTAAPVPLVLWLASNLILMLTTPRNMASA